MTGWIVVNHYLNNKRFEELYKFFYDAADRLGIRLIKKTNSELMGRFIVSGNYSYEYGSAEGLQARKTACEAALHRKEISCRAQLLMQEASYEMQPLMQDSTCEMLCDIPDFVLFWDKDVKLARMMEKAGFRVFNSADAIMRCDDKAWTNISLAGAGIKMPKTFVSPLTYFEDGLDGEEFAANVESQIPYPVVVKECMGSFGEQVCLAHNRSELLRIIRSKGRTPFIVQEFIKTSQGRDLRIYVAGGKARATIMRFNNKDFRANYVDGADMKAFSPTKSQEKMAVRVAELLGLTFGGIDILFGENDEPVFCEANSNAHFKKLYTVTGVNMAEEIIKCIAEKI